jgi:DNA mismatch repair protein MutH
MEREEAVKKLKKLEGKDLIPLAAKLGVTVWKDNGKLNKGWAGHTLEHYLGLPFNSAQAPNFGSWELKLVSLVYRKSGLLRPKETMAVTMIDPYNVKNTPFEESHLLAKLKKTVICARVYEGPAETSSSLYKVAEFDVESHALYETIRNDYELVRQAIIDSGFGSLSGRMGECVQPRTKGPGHGSISRAFYVRTGFLLQILGMADDC